MVACLLIAKIRKRLCIIPQAPLIYIINMFQFGRLRPNADIKMLQSEGLLIVIGCLA